MLRLLPSHRLDNLAISMVVPGVISYSVHSNFSTISSTSFYFCSREWVSAWTLNLTGTKGSLSNSLLYCYSLHKSSYSRWVSTPTIFNTSDLKPLLVSIYCCLQMLGAKDPEMIERRLLPDWLLHSGWYEERLTAERVIIVEIPIIDRLRMLWGLVLHCATLACESALSSGYPSETQFSVIPLIVHTLGFDNLDWTLNCEEIEDFLDVG